MVGLYLELPNLEQVPTRAVEFSPAWPLWSSGSDKQRFVILPDNEHIAGDAAVWQYPAGTIFSKTFMYTDGDGVVVPVETRLLRKDRAGAWDYATYRWRDDGSDADLLDMKLPVAVPVPGLPGGVHTIPSRVQCRICHESAGDVPLGFVGPQLAEVSPMLVERGVFATPPVATPIVHTDPTTLRVLGYFYGNCVHCHNGAVGDNNSFDLRPDVALANLIGVETAGSASVAGIRVVPGDPDNSVLWQAMQGESDDPDLEPMPPVGIDVVDAETAMLVREWIAGLPVKE